MLWKKDGSRVMPNACRSVRWSAKIASTTEPCSSISQKTTDVTKSGIYAQSRDFSTALVRGLLSMTVKYAIGSRMLSTLTTFTSKPTVNSRKKPAIAISTISAHRPIPMLRNTEPRFSAVSGLIGWALALPSRRRLRVYVTRPSAIPTAAQMKPTWKFVAPYTAPTPVARGTRRR